MLGLRLLVTSHSSMNTFVGDELSIQFHAMSSVVNDNHDPFDDRQKVMSDGKSVDAEPMPFRPYGRSLASESTFDTDIQPSTYPYSNSLNPEVCNDCTS
jgi:hypothetical protein